MVSENPENKPEEITRPMVKELIQSENFQNCCKGKVGRLVKCNGMTEYPAPANGKTFTLEELQAIVDGYIELVHLPYGKDYVIGIVDEEGRLKGKPRNMPASTFSGQDLMGDVLFCNKSMLEE